MQTSAEDTKIGPEDVVSKAFIATGLSKPKPADLSKLSDTFSDLDARLRAIIVALNDDIQIVIGSVQIQDAKAMKRQADLTMQLTETTMRQTEVSIRQTRWTVALAILAALYLPMTLVTGIFGMFCWPLRAGRMAVVSPRHARTEGDSQPRTGRWHS
jgi:Mg2+ and Co2+ transporter CorA